jgi:hypothetical protein
MDEYFKTKDLGQAAALVTCNHQLLKLERESNFYWFVFSKSAEIQANDYWANQLHVDAKHFADSIRSLKDRLHAQNY